MIKVDKRKIIVEIDLRVRIHRKIERDQVTDQRDQEVNKVPIMIVATEAITLTQEVHKAKQNRAGKLNSLKASIKFC